MITEDIDFIVITVLPFVASEFDDILTGTRLKRIDVTCIELGTLDQNQDAAFVLKVESLCIYGDDVREHLPGQGKEGIMRIISKMCLDDILAHYDTSSGDKDHHRCFIKRILKYLGLLCFLREDYYSRDLLVVRDIIRKRHPEYTLDVNELLGIFRGGVEPEEISIELVIENIKKLEIEAQVLITDTGA